MHNEQLQTAEGRRLLDALRGATARLDEVEEIVDAYRLAAPRTLARTIP